jgi:hypothetical protein
MNSMLRPSLLKNQQVEGFQRMERPPSVLIVLVSMALACFQHFVRIWRDLSPTHFVSFKKRMFRCSFMILSRSMHCLLCPLRPLMFHERIFMMRVGVGEGESCPR